MKINDSTPLIPAGKEPNRIDVAQKSPLPAAGPKAEALKGPGVNLD
ncbi:MAG: hypothetical protein RL184_138, partial [Pseudomonadota bacterium]